MKILEVTDAQIVDLYHRRWQPEAAGHLHGATLWATWDGAQGVHVGMQPGVQELTPEIKASDPEFAALIMGLQLPSAAEIVAHGVAAFGRWVAAGLPIVSAELRKARGAQCAVCPFWDPWARWGLGTCHHAACGCTQLKWWLATERCPAGKWPA